MELRTFASKTRLILLLGLWLPFVGCSSKESSRFEEPQAAARQPEFSEESDSAHPADDAEVDPVPRLLWAAEEAAADPSYPDLTMTASSPGEEGDASQPFEPVSIPLEVTGPSLEPALTDDSPADSLDKRPVFEETVRRLPPVAANHPDNAAGDLSPRLTLRNEPPSDDELGAAPPEDNPPLQAPVLPTVPTMPTAEGPAAPHENPIAEPEQDAASQPVSRPAAATSAGPKPPLAPAADPEPAEQRRPEIANGALQAVAAKAEQRARGAFVLAGRGAVYSARAELVDTLRMVAEALDAQSAMTQRSDALAAGLNALKEVDDFTPRGGQPERRVDLRHVISGHRTDVLKDADHESLTSLLAAQAYYTYAQEKLAVAGGRLPAASLALFGLGKLQMAQPARGADPETSTIAKAMVFQQAALLVESRNFLAANELGVLLARVGQWNDARRVLRHGVATFPQAELWKNLATVHGQLGEMQLAQLAHREAERAAMQTRGWQASHELDNGGGFVRWVTPQRFAQSVGQDTAIPRSPTY